MKKKLVEYLILFASLLLMGILGAIYSLVFAGVAGWAAIGIAPAGSFGLVQKYICPPDSSLQYAEYKQDLSQLGVKHSVNCMAQDGTILNMSYNRAVMAVNGMYFWVCFIPTFILGAILMRFTIRHCSQKIFETEALDPDDE